MHRTITCHLGRRGLALAILAALWLLMGTRVAATHDPALIDPGRAVLYEVWPLWLRVTAWCATGTAGLVAALWPRWQDAGWWALLVMPAERVISYIWSLAHSLIPGWPPGASWEALIGLVTWGGILSLLLLLAG